MLNRTHDPARTSWVESSCDPRGDFPIQNLPWCVFSTPENPRRRIGVGIGTWILDLPAVLDSQLGGDLIFSSQMSAALRSENMNALMGLPVPDHSELRGWLSDLLEARNPRLRDNSAMRQRLFCPQAAAQFHLPARIGNYTDFYASIHHATNVGTMLRPEQPLFPNYKWLPVAYHGRASSVVVSGNPVLIPSGQTAPPAAGGAPAYQKSRALDYELEIGIWIGNGNPLGIPLEMERAEEAFFGVCLLNDWSARDIQRWEYQPLGPFLAKNFLTSVSPWIVTREALAPFRVPRATRPEGDPQPLPHLDSPQDAEAGGIDIQLEVLFSTKFMRDTGIHDSAMSFGNFRDMYWTVAQMIAHHASNGCNLQSGDLLGSGTVSGAERKSRGCMLELTWDGAADSPLPNHQRTPLKFPSGESRLFLLEGDRVTLRGWCEKSGYPRIGLGVCEGIVAG